MDYYDLIRTDSYMNDQASKIVKEELDEYLVKIIGKPISEMVFANWIGFITKSLCKQPEMHNTDSNW